MMKQQDLNNIVKSIAERDKEITSLRAEVEVIQQHHKFAVEQWTLEAQQTKELEEKAHDLRAETDRLSRALAEAGRDAARYRWLREKHNDWYSSWRIYQPHKTLGSAAIDQGLSVDIDDVIDAAMAREE